MSDLKQALANVDWMQVVLNQGPPCFHIEDGRFCLRAERWDGHRAPGIVIHAYVSLADLLVAERARCAKIARFGMHSPNEDDGGYACDCEGCAVRVEIAAKIEAGE